MSKKLSIQCKLGVAFSGYAARYGDSTTDSCGRTANDTTPPIEVLLSFTNGYRHRGLCRFDASNLPKYSRIISAVLKKQNNRNAGLITINFASNTPIPNTVVAEIYPANIKLWNENANCQTYDGTHNWEYFLMEGGYDFVKGVRSVVELNQDTSDTSNFEIDEVDITDVVKELIYGNNYSRFDILIKPSDEIENNLPEQLISFSIRPYVIEIEYDEPVTFYGADINGNIDYSRSYNDGYADAYNVGILRIGSTTVAKKLFIQNYTDIDFNNVKIYNRQSYASKQFEMIYNTAYDNRDWDVKTTNKSENSSNYTKNLWYKIKFTSSTNFEVYISDKVDEEVNNISTWTSIGTGTIGNEFVNTNNGVSFTLPTPTTNPVANETIYFKTYDEDFVLGAPSDSVKCFEIAKDAGNTPDSFVPVRKGKAKIINTLSSTQFQLDNIDFFYIGATANFYTRIDGIKTTAVITNIDTSSKTITVDTSQTNSVNDYVDIEPEIMANSLASNQYAPFWVRGVGNTNKKERKILLLRTEME